MERTEWIDILSTMLPEEQQKALSKSAYMSSIPRTTLAKEITTKEVLDHINEVRKLDKEHEFVFYYMLEDPSSELQTVIRTTHEPGFLEIDDRTYNVYVDSQAPQLPIPWESSPRYQLFMDAKADPIAEQDILLKRVAALEDLNPKLFDEVAQELRDNAKKSVRKLALSRWMTDSIVLCTMNKTYGEAVMGMYLS